MDASTIWKFLHIAAMFAIAVSNYSSGRGCCRAPSRGRATFAPFVGS